MVFVKAGDLIAKFIKRSGDPQGLFASWVCKTYNELVHKDFPKFKNSKAKFFKGGNLLILVSSSSEAGELRLRAAVIINKLNQKIGKKVVKRLIFKVTSSQFPAK